jgi:hypothetical protein
MVSLHDLYLAHETSLAVLEDNELERLVKEAVTAIAVPASAGNLIAGDGARVVQAKQEDRGLDLAKELLVLGTSIDQSLAGLLGTMIDVDDNS